MAPHLQSHLAKETLRELSTSKPRFYPVGHKPGFSDINCSVFMITADKTLEVYPFVYILF